MSTNTFDNKESLYVRKMARQKQLDTMLAAAYGESSPTSITDRSSTSSPTSTASVDQSRRVDIEKARRFLCEDDGDEISTCAFKGGVTKADQAEPVTLIPSGDNTAWDPYDESAPAGGEDFLEEVHLNRSKLHGTLSRFGSCFLRTYQVLAATSAILAEHVTGLCRCSKRSFLILGALVAVVIFAVSLSAILKRLQRGVPPPPELNDSVLDRRRYNNIRNTILVSSFTDATDLDAQGTAQNLALRWLTDKDPAKLETDDYSILQRYALATFFFSTHNVYNSTMDDEWYRRAHWMTDKGICMWFGVGCVPHVQAGQEETTYNGNNDILHLGLRDNNIHGYIPSEIAALENLVSLDIGENSLEGTIPPSITSMLDLSAIYLDVNALTGTLATGFGELTGLQELYVGANQLTGTIPTELNVLTELRALGLNDNDFTGTIPFLWHLWNLTTLYLDSNQLSGTIHWEIKYLRNLMDLRMRENLLYGIIPEEMNSLENLKILYLDENELTGTIPEMFAKLPYLEDVQLHRNQLNGRLPETLSTLDDLQILYLDHNELNGTIHESFGQMRYLQSLYLNNNNLTDTIPTTVGNMKDLKELRIFGNKLSGPLPTEVGNCFNLEKLEIHQNRLTGTLPKSLGGLEKLTMLTVHDNEFTGSVPEEVCGLKDKALLSYVSADCGEDGGWTRITCSCCNKCHP